MAISPDVVSFVRRGFDCCDLFRRSVIRNVARKASSVTLTTGMVATPSYNNKLLEFAQTNTNVAFEFAQKLLGVKSPSEFIELSTERARKQFETLTEQTKELAAIAQKVTLASTEPLKAGVTKAFGQAS